MSGITRTLARYWADGPDYVNTYYTCHHKPDMPRAALNTRLRQIDAAENAQAREIETLAHPDDPHAPALHALRSRIVARFTELEYERTTISQQLADLDKGRLCVFAGFAPGGVGAVAGVIGQARRSVLARRA